MYAVIITTVIAVSYLLGKIIDKHYQLKSQDKILKIHKNKPFKEININ